MRQQNHRPYRKRFLIGGHRWLGIAIGLGAALVVGMLAEAHEGAGSHTHNDPSEAEISYALGYDIGRRFEEQDVSIDAEQLAAGLKTAQGDKENGQARLSEAEVEQVLNAFRQQLQQRQQAEMQAQAGDNLQAGEQFLQKNKQDSDVQETDSGLQYEVLREGEGQSPDANDEVTVHYRGELLNGDQFDSSYDRGEPATFPVNGVIDGWTEALQMMKPGAKWKLWIPADLAYGNQGRGQQIKPGSTLVFEVELISVSEQDGANQQQ